MANINTEASSRPVGRRKDSSAANPASNPVESASAPEIGALVWHRPMRTMFRVEKRTRFQSGIKFNGQFWLQDCEPISDDEILAAAQTVAAQIREMILAGVIEFDLLETLEIEIKSAAWQLLTDDEKAALKNARNPA